MMAESSKSVGDEDGDRRSTINDRAALETAFIVCTFCYLSLSHRLFLSTVSLQTLTHTHTDTHSRGTHSLGTHTHTQQDQVEEKQTNSLKRNCTTRSQILLRNLLASFSFVSRRCTQGTTTTTTNTAFIFVVELQILLMWHTKHITHAACGTYFRGFPKTNRVVFLVYY